MKKATEKKLEKPYRLTKKTFPRGRNIAILTALTDAYAYCFDQEEPTEEMLLNKAFTLNPGLDPDEVKKAYFRTFAQMTELPSIAQLEVREATYWGEVAQQVKAQRRQLTQFELLDIRRKLEIIDEENPFNPNVSELNACLGKFNQLGEVIWLLSVLKDKFQALVNQGGDSGAVQSLTEFLDKIDDTLEDLRAI
jgi:hypothetical protein